MSHVASQEEQVLRRMHQIFVRRNCDWLSVDDIVRDYPGMTARRLVLLLRADLAVEKGHDYRTGRSCRGFARVEVVRAINTITPLARCADEEV